MATIESSSSSWNGQGLVHQTGPFKPTAMDRMVKSKSREGMRSSTVNPYQINATGTLPPPSAYASAGLISVVSAPIPMKKRSPMGRAKNSLTLAARTPTQTGHKMGNAPSESVEYNTLGAPPAERIFTPIKTEPIGSFSVDDVSMGSPSDTMSPYPSILGKRRGSSGDDGGGGKKGKGPGAPGPSTLGKRRGSGGDGGGGGGVGKKGKGTGAPGPSTLGKRRGSELFLLAAKKGRNIFQGPLAPEPINMATKRKTEDAQTGSIKKTKIGGKTLKPKLKIDTSIGTRFGQGRKENKSMPKKDDKLPSPKTRAAKARATRR